MIVALAMVSVEGKLVKRCKTWKTTPASTTAAPATAAPTTTEAPTAAAPTTTPAPTTAAPKVSGNPACNPATWEKFSWACCTKAAPCGVGEGDCDNDKECSGNLVCGKNNCPEEFTYKYGKNRPDCCEAP